MPTLPPAHGFFQAAPAQAPRTHTLVAFRRPARPAARRPLRRLLREAVFHGAGGTLLLGLVLLLYLMQRALGGGGLPDFELEQAVSALLAL